MGLKLNHQLWWRMDKKQAFFRPRSLHLHSMACFSSYVTMVRFFREGVAQTSGPQVAWLKAFWASPIQRVASKNWGAASSRYPVAGLTRDQGWLETWYGCFAKSIQKIYIQKIVTRNRCEQGIQHVEVSCQNLVQNSSKAKLWSIHLGRVVDQMIHPAKVCSKKQRDDPLWRERFVQMGWSNHELD